MSQTPRLHVDTSLVEGASLVLGPAQAHYLVNVMRRAAGDGVRLFNVRDGEFDGVLDSVSKKSASVRIGACLRRSEASSDLWLLFAPVKRDAVDLIVQKATELGVAVLQPVATERTNASRVNAERLRAIATEAAEQSGRLSVPELRAHAPLERILSTWPQGRALIFCDEAGDDPRVEWGGAEGRAPPLPEILSALGPQPIAVLIGPEGGFSPDERQRLRATPFVHAAGLGPRILRADTAALAALAAVQALAGDWRPDRASPPHDEVSKTRLAAPTGADRACRPLTPGDEGAQTQ